MDTTTEVEEDMTTAKERPTTTEEAVAVTTTDRAWRTTAMTEVGILTAAILVAILAAINYNKIRNTYITNCDLWPQKKPETEVIQIF